MVRKLPKRMMKRRRKMEKLNRRRAVMRKTRPQLLGTDQWAEVIKLLKPGLIIVKVIEKTLVSPQLDRLSLFSQRMS